MITVTIVTNSRDWLYKIVEVWFPVTVKKEIWRPFCKLCPYSQLWYSKMTIESYFSNRRKLQWLWLVNDKKSCRPIQSVIILVIKRSDPRFAVSDFVNLVYRPNKTTLSPITTINYLINQDLIFSGEKSRALEWGPDGEVQKGFQKGIKNGLQNGVQKGSK